MATHYHVNVGCADGDFFYCDSWEKLCEWVSKKIGQKIETEKDIEIYNKEHWQVPIDYIVFLPKDYFKHRRDYLYWLRKCDDLLYRTQRLPKSYKRDCLFTDYTFAYDNANWCVGANPEVWQGEV